MGSNLKALVAALLLFAIPAHAQQVSDPLSQSGSAQYYAKAYGSCTWSATSDVGPCINAAIMDAVAKGGGTVILPAGKFGLSSPVVGASKVKIAGAGGGARTVCATEIEALSGFTGVMFRFSDVIDIGLGFMCVDALGRASKALFVESVGSSKFQDLILTEGADATLHVDISAVDLLPTSQNEFRNMIVRSGGPPPAYGVAEIATACRIGDYVADPPNGTNDVNNNTFDNFTCIGRHGYALDLRGADSNRFINVRFDNNGTGYSIFRAGLNAVAGPKPLLGWARFNTFIGASFGGSTDGHLLVEGSDCNVDGALVKRIPNPAYIDEILTPGVPRTLPVSIPATCPGNLNRRPSRDNMIYAYGKGGGQPNPVMSASADLFCNSVSIGGNCGSQMSPWLNQKSTLPVIPKVADYTISARDCGAAFNNNQSGIDIVFTLPPTSVDDGGGVCRLEFNRYANHKVTIQPFGTNNIRGAAGLTAAGEAIWTNDFQASIVLEDQSNNSWVVKASTGTWLNGTAASPSPTGRLAVYTFATLPTCTVGREGTSYAVTDSNSVVFNAALAGGGANHVIGYCNGTAWVVR